VTKLRAINDNLVRRVSPYIIEAVRDEESDLSDEQHVMPHLESHQGAMSVWNRIESNLI